MLFFNPYFLTGLHFAMGGIISGKQSRRNIVELIEETTANFSCTAEEAIRIDKALWTQSYEREQDTCKLPPLFCMGSDQTSLTASHCDGSSICALVATKSRFGSPCPADAFMRLLITYSCLSSMENDTLSKGNRAGIKSEEYHMAESVADRDTATEFVCGDRQTITVVAAQWTASLVWNEVQCAPSLIPCKGADVLEQVRQACIASGSVCKILPTKEDFGVPCGSALPMRLIITFICVDSFDSFPLETILGEETSLADAGGSYSNLSHRWMKELDEEETAEITCPGTSHISIQKAEWTHSFERKGRKCLLPRLYCGVPSLTTLIAAHCSGKTTCQMLATRRVLGNPCPEAARMRLLVSFACLRRGQEASPPHNSDCGITYPQKLWEIVAATTGVIACEESHGLSFLSANWMPSYRSTATGCAVHRGVCDAVDVLDLVQLYCPNGIEICQLRPTKRKFGVNCSKTTPMRLVVTYACIRPNSPCGAITSDPSCGFKLRRSRFCG